MPFKDALASVGAEVLTDLPGATPPKEGESMVMFILNPDGTQDLCTRWDGGQPYWISSSGAKYVEIDSVPEEDRPDWLEKGWTFTRGGRAV